MILIKYILYFENRKYIQNCNSIASLVSEIQIIKINFNMQISKCSMCIRFWSDHLFGIVVSTSACHPRSSGFESRLLPRIFFGSIGSGTGSTQPREYNLVATWHVIIISVLPKGRSFTANSGTIAAILPKGRSSNGNKEPKLQFY